VQKLQLIQCNDGLTDSQIAAIYADFENAIIEDFNLWMIVGASWMRAGTRHQLGSATARVMLDATEFEI
jgi:hypothetical protein